MTTDAASPPYAVIIPCFDDGPTLTDAVESALAQEPAPELVVVDDGSRSSSTIETLDALRDRGLKVVRQANQGPGVARTTGLTCTAAPLVLALDADDVLAPGALPRLAAVLDGSSSAVAAWGAYQRFGDSAVHQAVAPRLDPWQLTHQNDLPATALIRRWALEAVGGWRLAGGYEDWDLWMSLAERGWDGIGVDEVVYRYRRHGTRRLEADGARHVELVAALRQRHPDLFTARRRTWRSSTAPLGARLGLPLVASMPVSEQHKRVLAGVVTHLAHRRGLRTLLERAAGS